MFHHVNKRLNPRGFRQLEARGAKISVVIAVLFDSAMVSLEVPSVILRFVVNNQIDLRVMGYPSDFGPDTA